MGPGEGGALGPFAGLFQSLTVPVSKGCGAVWVLLGQFGGFLLTQAEICFDFFFPFSWAWRGCSSNPSAAFRGELDASVLVQDLSERTSATGEESVWPGWPEGLFWKKPEPGRESTPAALLVALDRGPTPEIHRVPICLPKLLREPFGFFPETGEGYHLSPHGCQPLWVFILLWHFGNFFRGRRGGEGEGGCVC